MASPIPRRPETPKERAERGILPDPPDFRANTHRGFHKRLLDLINLTIVSDIDGLEKYEMYETSAKTNMTSTSPIAMDQYRNLCVISLRYRAAHTETVFQKYSPDITASMQPLDPGAGKVPGWAAPELRHRYGAAVSHIGKITGFALPDGRQIAQQRDDGRKDAQIWLEENSSLSAPQSELIRHYSAGEERPPHLPPRLRHQPLDGSAPRPVAVVAIPNISALRTLLNNYDDFKSVAQPTIGNMSIFKTESAKEIPMPTNLILYGPPGTGKTYATAEEAVCLCGEDVPDGRDELMAIYRQLTDAGRIEFVTFHQSIAYEDFVEGLRPTTDFTTDGDIADDGGKAPQMSGGFRLQSRDGIFKKISERARLDQGEGPATHHLDRARSVFKIALGRRGTQEDRIDEGLKLGVIHLGWGGEIDWSDERFDSFSEIRRKWISVKDPEASEKDPNIEMIYALRAGMQLGDYVVLSDGRDNVRAVGQINGDYFYDTSAAYHPHRRNVEWLWTDPSGVARNSFYPNYFRRHSIYQLKSGLIDWDALDRIVFGKAAEEFATARQFVLIIDEINRANISKVFGELITLLETDKRLGMLNALKVRLPYSGEVFGVPANLNIIGTMNTADRSIALLDTALRRRFTFKELMPNPDLQELKDAGIRCGIDLSRLLSTINERVEYLFDREHQIGHAYFIGCSDRADVDEVMRLRIIPLLVEYFYEDWGKVAAVLGDVHDAEGDRDGGFLDRRQLKTPNGIAADGDASPRYRWQVRNKFDYAQLI